MKTDVEFGVGLDNESARLLREICMKFDSSKAQAIRWCVRTAYNALMAVPVDFAYEPNEEIPPAQKEFSKTRRQLDK